NTDYFPVLEFGAARARFLQLTVNSLNHLARDAVPVVDILSGLPPPGPVEASPAIANVHPRFVDVALSNAFAAALAGRTDSELTALADSERQLIERVMNL